MLWINPFLDVFYEWGRKQGYWETKRDVVIFLNGNYDPVYTDLRGYRFDQEPDFPKLQKLFAYDEGKGGDKVPIAPIREYLKENVPEWYYQKGWSMDIGGQIEGVIEAWENPNHPELGPEYLHLNPEVMPDGIGPHSKEGIGYPKELMVGGDRFLNVYKGYEYVQLINIARTVLNSLYFTTVKGQSWCNVSSPSRFINWTEDPFEEVKG